MFRARVYRFGRVRLALLLAIGLLVAAVGQLQVSAQNGAIAPSPGATPGTPTGSPAAGSGMLLITRYSCTSSAQASHIDVFPAGTPVATDDLQANGCVRSADDFILLWNSGTRARQIPVPGTGIAVVQDLAPVAAADAYRLVDSDSTVSIYVPITANQSTSVIAYQYVTAPPTEIPFPTMEPFPTFPPFPTEAPFPTERPFPTFDDATDIAGAVSDNGDDGGSSDRTQFKSSSSDRTKQGAVLILAALAFGGFWLWKRQNNVEPGDPDKPALRKRHPPSPDSQPAKVVQRRTKKRSGKRRF
jgi:hypothetical protein